MKRTRRQSYGAKGDLSMGQGPNDGSLIRPTCSLTSACGREVIETKESKHPPFVLFVLHYIVRMMRVRTIHEPVSAPDRAAARDALACLREGGALYVGAKRAAIALPPSVAREVETLLEAYAVGRVPVVSSTEEEVGTQQAAAFLKLSRPTVVKMMDEGRIPFRKPGKHRRVRMADLVAFERQLRLDQEAALEELSALGQEAIRIAREKGSFTDDMN